LSFVARFEPCEMGFWAPNSGKTLHGCGRFL